MTHLFLSVNLISSLLVSSSSKLSPFLTYSSSSSLHHLLAKNGLIHPLEILFICQKEKGKKKKRKKKVVVGKEG